MNDYYGKPFNLNYLRTKDGAEVDFCIVNGLVPELMIEAKWSDATPGRSLLHFHKRYKIPAIQLVSNLRHERMASDITIRKGKEYLSELAL